jgi:YceI-like protein
MSSRRCRSDGTVISRPADGSRDPDGTARRVRPQADRDSSRRGRERRWSAPGSHRRAAFTAKTSIDRKDFGLTYNQMLEAGGVMVGDRVDIEADIEAVRQVEAQVA